MIEIRRSPLHGRGVFATTDLAAGVTVETAPALLIVDGDPAGTVRSRLADYVIGWDERHVAVGLGLLSLCNHHDDPNAELVTFDTADAGPAISLITLRPIAEGDEVTVTYGAHHPVPPTQDGGRTRT